MIKAEQIPDAVGEAAMNAVKNGVHDPKAVVAAALNAWPGKVSSEGFNSAGKRYAWINFPLTENTNERE